MTNKFTRQIIKRASILTITLIITVLSVSAVSAQANYMSSFGIKLGEPFNVPECPIVERKYLGGGKYDEYAKDQEVENMCFQRDLSPYLNKKKRVQQPLPPLFSTGNVALVLPSKTRPQYIYDDYSFDTTITAYIIDGNFVGADFFTYGYSVPNTDLVSDLKEKYGKPTKITPQELKTTTAQNTRRTFTNGSFRVYR